MSEQSAERSFKQGLAALAEKRPDAAADFFLSAMQIEWRQSVRPDMRFLSYYGLSLARAKHALPQALQACECALAKDPASPALFLNLGRVYIIAGKTEQALDCFERGLRFAPYHEPLRRELSQIDRRSEPVVRSLSRSHLLNRCAGRIRASLQTHVPTLMSTRSDEVAPTQRN